MSIILGKKIGLENLIGGGKTPPENWEYLAHKVDGGTWEWSWSAPKSGWYSIHLIGDGGSGGKGGQSIREGSYGGGYAYSSGAGGGGGGHGGYGIHQMYLKTGAEIRFSRTAAGITAEIGENTVSVSHGKSGRAASGTGRGSGGAGGTASGANTQSLSGGAGSPGEYGKEHRIPSGDNSSQIGYDIAGGNGGVAGTIAAQKYSSGKAGIYKASAPEFDLGNAGTGGKGGALRLEDGGGISYPDGTAGGPGRLGGVVIDAAAT